MMQKVGRYYVPWFNANMAARGTLFQGRFRTSLVDAAHYLLACSRYIELNPVRARPGGRRARLPLVELCPPCRRAAGCRVTDHVLYWALGNTPFQREAAYMELVQQGLRQRRAGRHDRAALLKGWPLGSHAFKAELEKKTKRQILPAKRGRPFKVTSLRIRRCRSKLARRNHDPEILLPSVWTLFWNACMLDSCVSSCSLFKCLMRYILQI